MELKDLPYELVFEIVKFCNISEFIYIPRRHVTLNRLIKKLAKDRLPWRKDICSVCVELMNSFHPNYENNFTNISSYRGFRYNLESKYMKLNGKKIPSKYLKRFTPSEIYKDYY